MIYNPSLVEVKSLVDFLGRVAKFDGNINFGCEAGKLREQWSNYLMTDNEHPTEQKYPLQTKRFREILDEMYQVHLEKNFDYSPYNVNSTGMFGLVTRIWDKMARLANLCGLDLGTGHWNMAKEPKNESINDTLTDMSNYAIIARIYREGSWGK